MVVLAEGFEVYGRGDPELEREVQAEIDRRARRRRDFVVFLGGTLIVLMLVLILGPHDAATAASFRL
jgi:hypothetical protein